MLVFTSICPHPPILIPSVGQDSLNQIEKTQKAMQELAQIFYVARPETVIIISPHGNLMENAFTLNCLPEFAADFKQFGDLETELKFKADLELCYQIKESLTTKFPIQMISNQNLDHGVNVPLYYLSEKMTLKIIPLGYSFLDLETHFELGRAMAEIIHSSAKRIAIIGSGDLSHCLTKDSPAGYCPQGKKFDQQIIELIKEKNIDDILNMDKNFISEAKECALKSIIILLGVLSQYNYNPQILSYEGPFGVGYLVCNFDLNR